MKKRKIKIKRKLVRISAFYRSDLLDGLGIIYVVNAHFSPDKVIGDLMKTYEEDWKSAKKENRKKIVEHYFGQLNHFSKLRAEGKDKDRTPEESIICIINIWFLEKYKFLKSDEFNGCVFLYEASK